MTRTRRGRRPPPPEPGCLPVFRGVPSRPAPPAVGPPRPPGSPVLQRSPGRSGPRGRLPLLPTARAAPRVIANLESPLADLNEVSGSFRVWKKGGCPRAPALGEGGSWLPDSLLLMFTMGSSKSPAQQSEVLRGDMCTWGQARGDRVVGTQAGVALARGPGTRQNEHHGGSGGRLRLCSSTWGKHRKNALFPP